MPSTGLQCPRPFSLCLSYFFRLFSEAAAATLQTTNNFPFIGTWLFQILVRLHTLTLPMPCTRPPCPTETSLSQSPPLLPCLQWVTPFQIQAPSSWAFILMPTKLCLFATLWLMATHNQKSMNKGRKKVTVDPQQENDRNQQKQHLRTSMRHGLSTNVSLLFSNRMLCVWCQMLTSNWHLA